MVPRSRRYIRSNRVYELILRARWGLPFPTTGVIALVIKSALSRAQRDGKVTLCHFLWMGNHVHVLFVVHDARACVAFYQELQKKITESLKRLLGVKYLNIWEGEPVLAEILDADKAVDRIGYLYANPSNAHLVETIEEYPGVKTWKIFTEGEKTLDSGSTEEIPWIQFSTIDKLPSTELSQTQDRHISKKLRDRSNKSHPLTIYPNQWMKVFKIEDRDVSDINSRIINNVREREVRSRIERTQRSKRVVGARRLALERILKSHTPKPRERRIFVLSSITELRMEYLNEFKAFCSRCVKCFQRWKVGDLSVEWPPGAFRPYLPPLASCLVLSV